MPVRTVLHDQLVEPNLHDPKVFPGTGLPFPSFDPLDARYAGLFSLSSHVANTANPHGVTADQVGRTVAQWNASLLQGKSVVSTTPTDDQIFAFSVANNAWELKNRFLKSTITVGPTGSNAQIICNGTHDGVKIATAIAALSPAGGRLYFLNGTYNFDDKTDKATLSISNVIIEGESAGGVIFKATASLWEGVTNASGRIGMLTIGQKNTVKINNIIVRNIVFDCNHQDKTAGFTLYGGNFGNAIGLQDVLLDHVIVKNQGSSITDATEAGAYMISGQTDSFGSKAYIDGLTILDCQFRDSYRQGAWFLGGNITRVHIERTRFSGNASNGLLYYNYDGAPTSRDWILRDVWFDQNMSQTSASTQAHFRDAQQNGIENLTIDHCYFGPTLNPSTSQDFALTPYWAGDLRITNCFFDRSGSGVSLGASISGSYNKIFPTNRLIFENDIFFQTRGTFDPDAFIFGRFTNNIFYEVKADPTFHGYSRHFPTIYEGNLMYNCHAEDLSGDTDRRRALINIAPDGFIVRHNYFIDDRFLINPAYAATLTQVDGSTLAARTYSVRYSYANDTGETTVSSAQSSAIAANKLLSFTIQSSNELPSGAKKVRIYAGTTAGAETLQAEINLPSRTLLWQEPVTGLVTGSALPASNTTHTMSKFGIYELSGGRSGTYPSVYHDNIFIGINDPVFEHSGYDQKRIRYDNWAISSVTAGDSYSVELAPVNIGNLTGSTTVNCAAGSYLYGTLTGNVTATLSGGEYRGQEIVVELRQDATGSRTITWPSNVKKAGGSLVLSTPAGAVDIVTFRWDGTNWIEVSRSMGVS